MNYDSWLLFTSIALIATITPGPAILLVSTHSVTFGTKYSIATMVGNVTGLFIMSLLSVMGLSAIILHSVPIFLLVKGVGAGYLIFLGVKLWRQGFGLDAIQSGVEGGEQPRPRIMKLYFNGLFVALSNPQFIHPEYPMAQQFCILIATFMFLSFVCLLAYAVMAAETKNRSRRIKLPGVMSKVFGGVFIGSGVFLATATQK
jgi:threonine/homoserine/homoserine lactone efflux protein